MTDYRYYQTAATATSYYTTSTASTSARDCWYNSTGTYNPYYSTATASTGWYTYRYIDSVPETEQEKIARLKREGELNARLEAERIERAKKQVAEEQERHIREDRAYKLLAEQLGDVDFRRLVSQGYLEMDSRKYAGRKYRLPKNHNAYIEILDENNKVIDTLCIQTRMECPSGDRLLARWLLINFDEERLLKTSNHWGTRDHSYYETPVGVN